MDRIFDISFRINGELSGSFSSAIAAAQRQMRELNQRMSADTQRSLSRAARAEQDLMKLFATREAINQYKNLQQGIRQNSAALMQARLRTAQLRAEHQRELQQTEQMRQAYDRLKAVYQENQRSMSTDQRVAMQAQIRAAQEELRAQEARTRDAGRRAGSQGAETTRLENSLTQQRQRLEELRASLSAAGVSLSDMAAHEQELEESIRRTTEELERQRQFDAVRQRHAEAQANFGNAYDNLQNAFGTAQSIMSPFVDAVKVSMDFNQRMSEVKAIVGATGAEFDMLKAKAQELGASTMFSASDVVLGMKELGKSGFDANAINASIASNLNLAAAGELDLATSSKILSDALTMFKVPMEDYAKESEHFADVMAKTANSSNTSIELIGETMKYAGAVAGSMGYSFNDVAVATALMAKVGLNGSMAGTALRSTFTRLVSPPKDAAAALEKLGVSAVRADGRLKPFHETLTELRAGFSKLSKADKATFATDIAGLEAMSGFLAMVDADEKTFQETLAAIDNSQGTALKTAQDKTDNLAGAITTFKSAFEGIQIAIGDAFEEPLKNFVNSLASGLQSLTQWVSKNRELVQVAGMAAAAISGIVIAVAGFGVVSTGIEYLTSSFALLRTTLAGLSFANAASSVMSFGTSLMTAGRAAMAFAFSPIGAVLMAIALAGYYCYTHWSQVAPVFQSLANVLGGALQGAIQTLGPAFESLSTSASRLGPAFSQIGGAAFTAFALIANAVVRVAAVIITAFANAVKTVVELFSGLGNAIASLLAGDFSKAGEYLTSTLSKTFENVKTTFADGLKGAADVAKNLDVPLRLMSADNQTQDAVSRHAIQAQPQPVDMGKIVEVIAATFKNVTQEQNKDADLSKIESAISTAIESIKQDPKTDIAPQLQAISTAIESVKKENPEADTAKLEAVLQASMQQIAAAQQAQQAQQAESLQTNIEGLTVPLQQAGADMQTLQINSQGAGTELLNVQNSAQNVTTGLQTTQGQLTTFDGALQQPIGNLTNLGTAAGNAATQVGQLESGAGAVVSALTAKAAEISSIHISVPTVSAAPVTANFQGGIYSKGAFLTTFAEKSPEAAIPIDNSKRAVDLWTKTGQMLGQLPGKSFVTEQPSTAQKVSTIEQAQRRRLEQVKAQYDAAKKLSTPIEYDELGNIRGLDGLKDNIITKDDDVQVARAKKAAQLAEWRRKNSTTIESPKVSLPNSTPIELPSREIPRSIFSGRVQTQSPMPDIFATTQTQPRNYDTGLNIGDIFGAIGDRLGGDGGGILSAITERLSSTSGAGILPELLSNLPRSQAESTSPIDLHFEINITGNANAADVENGIKQTIPLIEETFEQKFANFKHEEQRRSF